MRCPPLSARKCERSHHVLPMQTSVPDVSSFSLCSHMRKSLVPALLPRPRASWWELRRHLEVGMRPVFRTAIAALASIRTAPPPPPGRPAWSTHVGPPQNGREVIRQLRRRQQQLPFATGEIGSRTSGALGAVYPWSIHSPLLSHSFLLCDLGCATGTFARSRKWRENGECSGCRIAAMIEYSSGSL
jgi:hypothetical protein